MTWGGPYKIEAIRDVIPEKVKPWFLLLFFLIFQFSGGVYMAAVSQMSGSLALMHEDIMMAGYASLVGLCLTFTVMYRLKFRFTVKTGLIVSATGLIICNLICLNTSNVPLLVAVSFVAGIFRMWGTFMCNTTIAPWIFPKWTMPKFQSYIQPAVMGFMLLSGLTTVYITYYFQWQYVHWFIIGVLLCMLLFTLIFIRHLPMKKMPLYGIDWMGAILLGVTALCAIFVLNYGEYYDWYQSAYIWMGTVFGIVAMGLNIWRASFIRHPFIANSTWRFRNVRITFLLLVVAYILVSPSSSLEHIYTAAILKYDSLNQISLNWISLLGYICGGAFAFMTLALRDWKFKTMTLIAFSLVVGYLLIMYFTIDYNLPKEALYFPIFLRSAGMIMIPITFLSAIFRTIPFQQFFQALNIVTIVTACCGPLFGSAVLKSVFKVTLKSNELFIGSTFDNVNPVTSHISFDTLYWSLQQQAMIVSMKEIYGWLCIAGLFCILAFLLHKSSLHPQTLHSRIISLKRTKKYELKLDRLHRE
jgi:MFS family permease